MILAGAIPRIALAIVITVDSCFCGMTSGPHSPAAGYLRSNIAS